MIRSQAYIEGSFGSPGRRPRRRGISHLLIATGLALTLIVSLTSPLLAHESRHGKEERDTTLSTSRLRAPNRLEFMLADPSSAEAGLIGGTVQPGEVVRGLTIGGTAAHQRTLVVRHAPSGPDISTTSSDWRHVPELYASIDTPANASLAVSVTGEASASGDGRMFVRALIDGQPARPSDVVFARGDFNGARAFTFVASNLASGTHTIQIQWRVDGGYTAYLGDHSLAVSASPDSPERGALTVVAAPSGPDVSTAAQSWQGVPHLSTNIMTAAGADLALTVSAEASAASNGRVFLRALIDGQPAAPSDVVFVAGAFRGTRSFTFTANDLGAGTHNVQIEWLVDDGSTGYFGDRTLIVAASPPASARNALAVASSPSGPSISTDANAWQNIPHLQSDIDTAANTDLAIALSAEAYTSGAGRLFVRALVDGQPAGPSDVILARGGYFGTGAALFIVENVSAGSHTVQLQWLIDQGHTAHLGDRSMTVTAGQRERQHLWTGIDGPQTGVAPAVEGLESGTTGTIYVVAITTAGQVRFTTTNTPTVFSAWATIGNTFAAHPDTAPALVRDGNQLHLAVRGADNNLYVSRTALGQPWSPWAQLTGDGSVHGDISFTLTRTATSAVETHVLYQGADSQLRYRRYAGDVQTGSEKTWTGVQQGSLGSDGADTVVAVILKNDRQGQVHGLRRPWASNWQHAFSISPNGTDGGLHDISNVEYFAESLHVAIAVKEQGDEFSSYYRHTVKHLQIQADNLSNNVIYDIAAYTPAGDRHALSSLVLYRNKLLAAFTMPDGHVRQARWDNTDEFRAWVSEATVDASRKTDHRPDLGVFNMRAFHGSGNAEYGISNYGFDAIAVATERGAGRVNLVNFSRALFLREIDAQLKLYHANGGAGGQGDVDSPTLVDDLSQDGRPFVSELGYALWTLPGWLAKDTYGALAKVVCVERSNTSGRFEAPCDHAKYPVIIKESGDIGIASGIWHTQTDNYIRFWEELGHTTAGTMGLADDGQGGQPSQKNADLVPGIPLNTLREAYDLFGERTVNRPKTGGQAPDGRFRGFTGIANNYDANSRQHSFIYVVYYYVSDGDRLRGWIEDDLATGDDLLQRKYEWIRTNIYNGVEFRLNNAPLID